MKPVEVRSQLVDALRLDLVGPDNGSDLEAEILPQAPSLVSERVPCAPGGWRNPPEANLRIPPRLRRRRGPGTSNQQPGTPIPPHRTQRIVPTPFFVASDMIYPMQAADLCIYCVNWGFRLPSQGMTAVTRHEIANEFGPWLRQLQFRGEGYRDRDSVRDVRNLLRAQSLRTGARHEKGGKAVGATLKQTLTEPPCKL